MYCIKNYESFTCTSLLIFYMDVIDDCDEHGFSAKYRK